MVTAGAIALALTAIATDQATGFLLALTGAVLGGTFIRLPRSLPRAVRAATNGQVNSRPGYAMAAATLNAGRCVCAAGR